MNVLVPLAGKSRAFENQGLPKPLTLVSGKPLIQLIAESRPFSYREAIFVILKDQQEKHLIRELLKGLFGSDIRIIIADELTEGAPQSALLAKDMINTDEPLIIDLADQYLDLPGFMDFIMDTKAHGVIPAFESVYPKRPYMTYGEDGMVSSISENDPLPISTHSASCVYFFKKGSDFVQSAENMIAKNRVAADGTYAISLAYNEMIESEIKVAPFCCDFITSLETPEGVAAFEQLVRPLRCGKDVFRLRVSECPIFQNRGKRPRPENSVTSIRNALNWGFSASIDVRAAKDGAIILSHDDDLSRTTGSKAKVSESTAKALSKLYFDNTDENLATLDEALNLLSKRSYGVLAIHVEGGATVESIRQICTKILSRGLENRTFIFGDDAEASRLAKSAYPAINTGLRLEAEDFTGTKLPQDIDVYWVGEKKKGGITSSTRAAAKRAGALSIAMSPELMNPKVSKKEVSSRCKDFFGFGFDGVCTSYF
jgi:glycerophosphoryl diester phosphodiesterase/dTDP-glucose pyrophosphorylase